MQSGNPKAWSGEYWDAFVADCMRLDAPLYAHLADRARRDSELCALAALAHETQPPANLLLGAVHFLLLRGAQHPLRCHYRTVSTDIAEGDAFPHFRDFCLQHKDALATLIRTRVTNTNEVRRCIYLHAGFLVIAAEAPRPLHTIEIGPSAGLNLSWDKYGYRYLAGDGRSFGAGARDAPLTLETRLVGGKIPPLGLPPPVARKIGLELHPVDLANRDDRDWLRALIWPDAPERMARLDSALAVAAREAPDIRAGDAVDLLPEAAAEIPRQGALCIFHTMTVHQFPEEKKQALLDLMLVMSLRRPVWRLWMEYQDGVFSLFLDRYADGSAESRLLAHGTGHATEMDWRL
jgi:hypothetical protein